MVTGPQAWLGIRGAYISSSTNKVNPSISLLHLILLKISLVVKKTAAAFPKETVTKIKIVSTFRFPGFPKGHQDPPLTYEMLSSTSLKPPLHNFYRYFQDSTGCKLVAIHLDRPISCIFLFLKCQLISS
jgi:hypothetical protein